MKTTLYSLCAAAALVTAAHAAGISFGPGPLELSLDDATGGLVRISYKGEVLAACEPNRSPVTFGVRSQEQTKWLEQFGPRRLIKREQPAPDTLELTIRAGDFELLERYKLVAGQARLDRSVTLTNRGTETIKLWAFAFKTFGVTATKDGFYRFPKQWPPGGHPFAEMKQGGKHGSGGSVAPLVAQLTPQRSLVWLSFATEPAWVRVEEGQERFDVVQDVHAAGYLKPNQPQEIGFVSMQVVDAGYWDALPALWKWMDNVGLTVPADRPPWVEGAILYCFHPGGTIGSDFKDLGGFKNATAYLLPTIPKLGATAIWIMPIEQKSPYWPYDYYKFMDGLGTGDDYKALVKRAHELGLHVWQDLVPHGGSPQAVHNQAHPEFMLRREDGSHLNYWLNDFAWPDWQKYIAGVAAHYAREYGVDGYRVDACGGSKEPNWNPEIPYARASHALLWGGLGMLRGIRAAVREVNPREGAILAEAEDARLMAVSDAEYDFGFCYNVCHQWRKESAADFVAHLQEYLEEQKYVEPRGTVRLRHVESHDSLRAEGWYGVDGMHALYALSAWIDGIPLIYHGMENGHSFALKGINDIRKSRPELSRGEAFYRAVQCDTPGVFTCLRKLGDKQTVFAINFGRERVKAKLTWAGGNEAVALEPLEYALVPPLPRPPGRMFLADAFPRKNQEEVALPGATEWMVDTISGRLHGEIEPCPVASPTGWYSSIYWRPQGTNVIWSEEMRPILAGMWQIVTRNTAGKWTQLALPGSLPADLRLVRDDNGLRVVGLGGATAGPISASGLPPRYATDTPFEFGPVTFRCIGPDLIVSNKQYTVVLRRQGGVIRELTAGGKLLAKNHDLYGDQAYMKAPDADRIAASNDVECSLRIEKAENGLRLSFEGQLRGFERFALKKPPIWFRNEYVFTDAPRFHQKWAFRTEKTFKDKTAFLSAIVQLPAADRFRFLRGKDMVAEDTVGQGNDRSGQTKGQPAYEKREVRNEERELLATFFSHSSLLSPLSLSVRVPEGADCNLFVSGRQFFITLLDGSGAAMEQGRWYEFEADWNAGP